MIINLTSAVLAGFSIVSSFVLLIAYLFYLDEMRKTLLGKIAAVFVLTGLACLQLGHFLFYVLDADVLNFRIYCVLLMLLPSAFFFFSRETLFSEIVYKWLDTVHFLPIIASLFLPLSLIPAIAFLMGAGYTFWFVTKIYTLRDQRSRFRFEMFFFGMFALMAAAALLLGLALPVLDNGIFYVAYGNAISIAMIMVVAALLIFPELLNDIAMITELAYAKSKLAGINTEQKLIELEQLMTQEKLYENEQLSLSSIADVMELSSHQLSELVNTEYGYSFPRLIREHRVRAAKALLVSEPNTSILAISMMIGFKSQSNFYTAFKESTGESPGHYRQKRLA